MKVSAKQVEQIAHHVVSGLLSGGHLSPQVSHADLEAAVRAVITEDLAAEDVLDREVERLLAPHAERMDAEGADYRKMFNLLKQKLARERGIVL
ncbi:MAG: hypothetical protein A2Y95_12010 [Deltaproteobacteria bacterium RBG_13_65_10]|nr:MAG: hypothetical protein A2Y95_12010 [Deltaproteobacteria bacterium RBG_13_65_10]